MPLSCVLIGPQSTLAEALAGALADLGAVARAEAGPTQPLEGDLAVVLWQGEVARRDGVFGAATASLAVCEDDRAAVRALSGGADAAIVWPRDAAELQARAHEAVRRRRRTRAIAWLAGAGPETDPRGFFPSLALELSAALGVRSAFVGELLAEGSRLRTLGRARDAALLDEARELLLDGSALRDAMHGGLHLVTAGARDRYPQDALLADGQSDSFLGLVLGADQGGGLAGVLAVHHDGPLDPDPGALELFQLFAARARRELSRRAAEQSLRDRELRYRSVFQGEQDSVMIVELGTGRIVEVNEAFVRAYGWTPEEATGLRLGDLSHERPQTEAALRSLDEKGALDVPLRWHKRKDGTTFAVEVFASKLHQRAGALCCISTRDISARLQLEAQLLLADRMSSVGTLAAGVAHEINNPLAFVLGNLDFLEGQLARSGERAAESGLDIVEIKQALQEARSGAGRVRDIVRDLKTFSRPDDKKRGRVDVRRVMEVSLRLSMNEILHRARLTKELAEVPLVEGDESRLGQVFMNLLSNAVQALPDRPVEQSEIRVSTRTQAGGLVAIEVQDNGKGMSRDQAGRIFDPFFTTKAVGGGTGLGLSICHGIVRALGGRIEVITHLGRGSLFRVLLPAAQVTPVESPAPPPRPDGASQRPRVLIIDDEVLLARSAARMLGSDHEVATESDARTALQRLLGGERFDVVLCDLMMPGMTGMELFEALEREAPEVALRMGFLTGGAFTQRAIAFRDRLPDRHLEKPFTGDGLRHFLRKLLAS